MQPSETLLSQLNQVIGEAARLAEVVERQRQSENVRDTPPIHDFLIELQRGLRSFFEAMVESRAAMNGESAGVKRAVRVALTAVAGLFESLKGEPLFDLLRRDYTALSHVYLTAGWIAERAVMEGMEDLARSARECGDTLAVLLRRAEKLLPVAAAQQPSGFVPESNG